jgi:hypothetical protein
MCALTVYYTAYRKNKNRTNITGCCQKPVELSEPVVGSVGSDVMAV